MSQEWIKVCKETPAKPEVIAIAAAIGTAPCEAFSRLFRLWSWADSHTTSGFARGATLSWVDQFVGAIGFAEAMVRVGWLTVRNDGLQFPNFERHMGASAKKRALNAKRQERFRNRNASSVTRASRALISSSSPKGKKEPFKAEEFEEFWRVYPRGRKGSKGDARKAWKAALKKAPAQKIISAAQEYSQSPVGKGQYVKGPAPWLNQECWDDDRAAWKREDRNGKHLGGGSLELTPEIEDRPIRRFTETPEALPGGGETLFAESDP